MGTRLDDLLNESAPVAAVSDRQRAATRELARSIASAEGRRGPRRGSVLAGGVLTLALLGGATAAAAATSPAVRLAFGWVPDRTIARTFEPLDGSATQACTAYFHVMSTSYKTDPAAIERARIFISTIDADSVQPDPETLATLRDLYGAKDPLGTAAQMNAYGTALAVEMWEDLKAHGYSDESYEISFDQNSDCGDRIAQ